MARLAEQQPQVTFCQSLLLNKITFYLQESTVESFSGIGVKNESFFRSAWSKCSCSPFSLIAAIFFPNKTHNPIALTRTINPCSYSSLKALIRNVFNKSSKCYKVELKKGDKSAASCKAFLFCNIKQTQGRILEMLSTHIDVMAGRFCKKKKGKTTS